MKDVMFCRDNDLITSPYLFKTSKSTVGEEIFYNGGPKRPHINTFSLENWSFLLMLKLCFCNTRKGCRNVFAIFLLFLIISLWKHPI